VRLDSKSFNGGRQPNVAKVFPNFADSPPQTKNHYHALAPARTPVRAGAVFCITAAMPQSPYIFSAIIIGAAYATQIPTFADLAEKLGMDVRDLMRQCNAKAPPSRALVKGLAQELDIDESYLWKLAEEVRKDLGAK
jgi:hypothetical protein